jgi:nitrate/nitrite-specific signal transduction histidine kinase
MENKNEKSKSENKETNIFPKNNLNQDKDESIVKDLKESLKQTVDETLETFDELLTNIESTIEEKSIYETTKEMVQKINSEVSDTIKNQISLFPQEIDQIASNEVLEVE